MLARARQWHKSLSRKLGHRDGRCRSRYSCPVWADIDAYTRAYLKAKGIIPAYEHA